MSKPNVIVYVLTGIERHDWLSPWLCIALLRLQQDSRFDLSIHMADHPFRVEHARNMCVADARERGAAAMCMIDNDNVPPYNFGDILHDAISTRKAVVMLSYGVFLHGAGGPEIIPGDNGPKEGNFRVTGCAGTGVTILSSEVWRVLPRGPWFKWLTNDDEMQSRQLGEDYYFCELVQQHGMKVWTHHYARAGHLKTWNVTGMAALRKPLTT
jgi:hypothetical protein